MKTALRTFAIALLLLAGWGVLAAISQAKPTPAKAKPSLRESAKDVGKSKHKSKRKTQRKSEHSPKQDSSPKTKQEPQAEQVADATLRVYSLHHTNGVELLGVIRPLFHKSELEMTCDPRTNSIMALGKEADHAVLEAVLLRLDGKVEKSAN